jgi:cyclase
MMLKTRIIPTLLWKGYGLVKGTGFDSWRPIGAVLPAIKVYNARHVDELLLLDIAATKEGREPDYESIDEFTSECFVPLTYGGGIASLDHIRKALLAGADKVCLNTAAVEDPELVRSASDRFGAQCVVVGIEPEKERTGNTSAAYGTERSRPGKLRRNWPAKWNKRAPGRFCSPPWKETVRSKDTTWNFSEAFRRLCLFR